MFFILNYFFDFFFELLKRKGYYFTYTLIEYLAFAYILAYVINNKRITNIIIILSVLFSAFIIFYYSTATVKRIDSVPIGIGTILIFMYTFFFFSQHFKKINGDQLYANPGFWMVTGILIYLGSTFFFNILANELDRAQVAKYWYLTYIGDIMKNIFASIAIILYIKYPSKNNRDNNKTILPYLDMV